MCVCGWGGEVQNTKLYIVLYIKSGKSDLRIMHTEDAVLATVVREIYL